MVNRVRRNLRIKRFILFGAVLTSPLLAFANVKPEISHSSEKSSSHQNISHSLEEQNLRKLQNEGAISRKEAERLLNNLSNKETPRNNLTTNSLKGNSETSNSTNLKKVELQLIESDSRIKLKLINLKEITKSEIIKSDSGWHVILQLPNGKTIDTQKSLMNLKNISDIKISKFNKNTYFINIIENKKYNSKKPIINRDDDINIEVNILPNKSIRENKNFSFPFLNRFRRRNSIYNNRNEAVAPPLGDIASGSLVIKNRGFINLIGPNVSLTLNNASAKDALMRLSKLAGYGFVLANESSNIQSKSISTSEETNIGPKVTLSFVDEDYSIAFNSILLASGLQAKKNQNLIIVGKDILGKSFEPNISKVYRLNQSSASSAADYLATLGASITKVDTISNSSSGGGGASRTAGSMKYIDSYSATTGPLVGLTGTTDSRLQSITLVGPSAIVQIAEKYLKQLDLRQRQVALSVKILDVEITDNDSNSISSAFRSGSTFIVNEQGKLFSAFGNFLPPAIRSSYPSWKTEYENEFSTSEGTTTKKYSTKESITDNFVTPNPGLEYTANQLYSKLIAEIRSANTKVLANPTLILSESRERIEGGAEVVGSVDSGQSTIGRPFANESFVTLGTQVITNYEVETGEELGITSCKATLSTAGLTFGARVHKIDDNGFVTFSLSPELTSISDQIENQTCGPMNILNIRRLDTGQLRVKDSQTLILTGVISDFDNEIITKTPLLGDIPILGRLFRSTSGNKRKSELVILVTPKIIDDSYPEKSNTIGVGFNPTTEEGKNILKESL